MAIIQTETRESIRQAIGEHLGAVYIGTANGSTSASTLVDSAGLIGGDDDHIGKWILVTDATDGTTVNIRRIGDYTASSTTLSFATAMTFTPASSDTYELWDEEFDPNRVNRIINDVISEISDRVLVPDEDTSLYGDMTQQSYTIPTNIVMISKLQYRASVDSEQVDPANTDDWTAGTNVTVSKDSTMYKEGGSSLNLVTGDVAAAVLASKTISSIDISDKDTIEFWLRSTVALSAGNLTLSLNDSTDSSGGSETLSVPAISADTWTRVKIDITNQHQLTAIVKLKINSGSASVLDSKEIWINEIRAYNSETEHYETLDNYLWKVNREDSKLHITSQGRGLVFNKKLKIVGFDKPATLSADSSTCEINPSLIIYLAAYRLLMSISGGRVTDSDDSKTIATQYRALAERILNGLATPQGVPTA